jgi:hypothetical protein
MSLKAQFFDEKLKAGPAVKHNYLVQIPGFRSLAYLVLSASIPSPSRGMSSINFMGEVYSFPVPVDLAAGEFSATLYETAAGEVTHAFYDSYINGVHAVNSMFDILIYSYQMNYSFPIITRLIGCWIKGFGSYSLNGSAHSDVVSCDVRIHYNGVELVEDISNYPVSNLAKGLGEYEKSRQAISKLKSVDPIANALGLNTSIGNLAKIGDINEASIATNLRLLNSLIHR